MVARSNNVDFLEHFYEHLSEDDWLEGVDIYQAGRVTNVQTFHGLMTAKVVSISKPPNEVRLKIHPSGRVIQWIECTCRKNRTYGQFCEHIAALMIHIDREKKEFFSRLDNKMPIKPPNAKRARKTTQTTEQQEAKPKQKSTSASQSLLSHLQGTFHSLALVSHGPCCRVRLEIKPGSLTHYDLDLDASARFIKANKNHKNATQEVKKLTILKEKARLGTRIYQHSDERIVAERVVAIPIGKKFKEEQLPKIKLSHTLDTYKFLSLADSQGKEREYLFFPIKSANKYIGKEFIFIPGVGYGSLDQSDLMADWHDLPLSKSHKDDDAAKFIENNFHPYLQVGPIFLDQDLKDPVIMEVPSLSAIEIHSESDGWFKLDPKYGKGDAQISMVELRSQYRAKKRKFVKTGNVWFKIPDFVTQHEWEVDESGQFIKVDALGLMRLKAAVGDFDQFVGSKKILGKIRDKLEFNIDGPTPKIGKTNLNLRNYQELGLKWLWWLYKNQLHGLLADEMGLGKTHQAMALLSAIQKEKSGEAKFLVVCPTTVLDHWEDKVKDFAPGLMPVKYHGPKRLSQFEKLEDDHHTIITSYGVLLRDIKRLLTRNWDAIVLDEAHYVKNQNTATYKAACRLNSRIRICLTGTPMENHLGELKNLFDFLVPGYLGSDDYFKEQFLLPIEHGQDPERELALQKLIYPFKLRRIKEAVLDDLPSKVEDIRHCYLSEEQVKLYREIIEMRARPLLDQLSDNQSPIPYLHVFATLQLLKQVCDHPALLTKEEDKYEKYESGKFEVVKEIINEAIDSGNKIVIFSQYLGMIKILRNYFTKEGIGHVVMTGQTRNRGKVIEKFQTDDSVKIFVGSLLAGGIGIDLTAASVVIHYDRWWNPTKENQATDRVHRIGQKKFVQVMKMVTRGTLEEKIDTIIQSKQSVFKKFLEQDEEIFKTLSRQDLIELLQ